MDRQLKRLKFLRKDFYEMIIRKAYHELYIEDDTDKIDINKIDEEEIIFNIMKYEDLISFLVKNDIPTVVLSAFISNLEEQESCECECGCDEGEDEFDFENDPYVERISDEDDDEDEDESDIVDEKTIYWNGWLDGYKDGCRDAAISSVTSTDEEEEEECEEDYSYDIDIKKEIDRIESATNHTIEMMEEIMKFNNMILSKLDEYEKNQKAEKEVENSCEESEKKKNKSKEKREKKDKKDSKKKDK